MTPRTRLVVYAGTLLALVALYVVGSLVTPRASAPEPLLPGLEPTAVNAFSISSAEGETVLQASGERWNIMIDGEPYPARDDRITTFLSDLAASRAVRTVTRSRDLWTEFGLAEGQGVRIILDTASAAAGQLSVLWGAISAEPGLSYVRVGTAPDVLAADGELQFFLAQPSAYWSYLRLLPEDVAAAAVIAITAEERRTAAREEAAGTAGVGAAATEAGRWQVVYELRREAVAEGERWVDGSEREVDDVLVGSLLRDATDIVADEFVTSGGGIPAEPGPGDIRVTLHLEDGRSYAVRFTPVPGGYSAMPEGENLPGASYGGLTYRLGDQKVRRLIPEALREDPNGALWNVSPGAPGAA